MGRDVCGREILYLDADLVRGSDRKLKKKAALILLSDLISFIDN